MHPIKAVLITCCLLLLKSPAVKADQINVIIKELSSQPHPQFEIQIPTGDYFVFRFIRYDQFLPWSKKSDRFRAIARLDLQGYGLLYDFHPFGKSFRLSAGYVFNNHHAIGYMEPTIVETFDGMKFKLDKSQIPDAYNYEGGTFDITDVEVERLNQVLNKLDDYRISYQQNNDGTVTVHPQTIIIKKDQIPDSINIDAHTITIDRDTINATVDVNLPTTAQYFGIGFGNTPSSDSPVRFSLDIGMIKHKRGPTVEVYPNGALMNIHPLITSEILLLAEQKEIELENKWKDKNIIPYISLGLSYYF